MNDKLRVVEQVHLGAQIHGDTAPALELVGARRAVLHAAALVVVVEAGGARHVVVGLSAAAQALAVAALALVRAGELAALRTDWGDRGLDVRNNNNNNNNNNHCRHHHNNHHIVQNQYC